MNKIDAYAIAAEDLLKMPFRPSKVERRGNYYIIKGPYEYEIEIERCDTHTKLVEWIAHLTEKNWITAEHISDLIRATEFKRISC